MSEAVGALEDLLEDERRCLLAGDLDRVLRLASHKEALLSDLPASGPQAAELERLRRAAERNAGLLAAAAQGVRAASDRMRCLLEGPAPLATYDAGGRRQTLGGDAGGTVHRA